MKRRILVCVLVANTALLASCASGSKNLSDFSLKDIKLPKISLPKGTKSSPAADFPKDQVPHILLKKPVASGRLTSGFGYRLNPSGVRLPKKHNGIDYAAPVGTAILASGDGVVEKKYLSTSYGNFIQIKHANGFSSAYAHLDSYASGIEEGSKVSKGQVIGAMGTSGRSTASHLHYELKYKGKPVDPLFEN